MRHPDRIRALAVFLVSLGVAMAGVAANTTVTYTFNGADQLTQVSSSQSGVVARFTYDGDNLRATKTVGSVTVIYVRGPSGEVIAEYSGSGVLLAEYVYLDGQRVCKITKDGQGVERRVYYHSDIVGTPVALTDEAGQLIAKAEYLPFGEEVVHGAAPDVHKFTGKELDEEIGLYDFGARYYDARLGRFITVDPVAGTNDDPQSWNRYAYTRNNPLRFVDRNGLYEEDVHNDLTVILALAAGIPQSVAGQIGRADQGMDEDPATAATLSSSESTRALYHFTTPERRGELWSLFEKSGSPDDLGAFLHADQDSFSHQGFGPKYGHLRAGHAPDKTYNDPLKASEMARETFERLQAAAPRLGVPLLRTVSWKILQSYVSDFAAASTAEEKDRILTMARRKIEAEQSAPAK